MILSRYLCLIALGILLAAGSSASDSDAVSVAEGELTAISAPGDAVNSDYPNCFFTARFHTGKLVSGKPVADSVILAFPSFLDRKYTPYRNLKIGDWVRVGMVAFDDATEFEKSTQQSDDLKDFSADLYFVRSATAIAKPAMGEVTKVAEAQKTYRSGWSAPVNPPLPEQVTVARNSRIAAELIRVQKDLHTEEAIPSAEVQAAWAKRSAALPQIKPGYYWFQAGEGVFCLPEQINFWGRGTSDEWRKNSLEALKSLNKYLQFHHIQLLVIVYPEMYPVALRAALPELRAVPQMAYREIVMELLRNDIEAIDLSEEVVNAVPQPGFLFFYWHQNEHPGWVTQDIAAQKVSAALARFDFPRELAREKFSVEPIFSAMGESYLYPKNLPIGNAEPGRPVKTLNTLYDGKRIACSADSSVLVVGNSFIAWPGQQTLLNRIIAQLCYPIRGLRSSGCFTSVWKDFLLHPEGHLAGVKAVVIPVSISMLKSSPFLDVAGLDMKLKMLSAFDALQLLPLPEERSSVQLSSAFEQNLKKHAATGIRILLPKAKETIIYQPAIPDTPGYSNRVLQMSFVSEATVDISGNGISRHFNPAPFFAVDTMLFQVPDGETAITIKAFSPYGKGLLLMKAELFGKKVDRD